MKIISSLFFWLILAFIVGSLIGIYLPISVADTLAPLGTSFIRLIKIFISPIIFLTVATGIAKTGSMKRLGKTALYALIYFEIISTLALLLGWIAAVVFHPGNSMHTNPNQLDAKAVTGFFVSAQHLSVSEFLQNIIPTSIVEPFAKNNMLQVLLLAILFGSALLAINARYAKSLIGGMEKVTQCLFQIIRMIMYASPLGVLGGMAFSTAHFGGHLLIPLFGLIGLFWLTAGIFVAVVLNAVAILSGFSLWRFLKYIFTEIVLVLGTSSSESALPQLMRKLESLGCRKETIGIVIPIGYSFNLDGTNIYMTLAALFIAQSFGIHLTMLESLALFATAMLSSKGAAGVTGSGFITLAATLAVVPTIPLVGIVLILGIDRFMSEARSVVNFIGNGVAGLALSRWQGEVSAAMVQQRLAVSADC